MPSAAGVRAGKAFIVIEALDKTGAILNRIGGRIQAFGSQVTGLGSRLIGFATALAAPFLGALAHFTNFGDQLDKMSQRTGISVESLSTLKFAAEQSGASLDAVANVVQKMNRRLGRLTVGAGTQNQLDAMRELGLSVDDLRQMSPEERLLAIAEGMKQYGDDAAAAGLAQRAFGTGVDALIPLLLQGRDGIEGLKQEARDLNLEVSGKQAKSAAEMADAWNRVKSTFEKAAFEVGAALAPSLIKIIDIVAKMIVGLIEWIQNNRGLIATVFAAIVAIAAIGAALIAAGLGISALGFAFTSLATILAVVKGAILFLLSPLGLVLLAIAAVIAIMWFFSKSFREAIGQLVSFLSERFGQMADTIKMAFRGVKAAIELGDTQALWDVAIQGMELLWLQLTDFIIDSWNTVSSFVMEAWAGAMAAMKQAWFSAQKTIAQGILDLTSKSQLLSAAFGLVAGVNVKEDAEKIEKQNAERTRLLESRREDFVKLLAQAQAQGGQTVDEVGDVLTVDDIQKIIRQLDEALERPATTFQDTIDSVGDEFDAKIAKAWEDAGDTVNKQREAIEKANAERAAEIKKRQDELRKTVEDLESRVEAEAVEEPGGPDDPDVGELDAGFSFPTPALQGLERGSIAAAEKFSENTTRPIFQVKDAVEEGNRTLEDILNELKDAPVLREA